MLFEGLSGTYTPSRTKSIGFVKPGESIGVNLGMALSLNLDTSLSFNYSYNYSMGTKVNKHSIKGSDLTTSTFTFGLSRAQSSLYAVDLKEPMQVLRDQYL